jgi:hypothetical protein
MRYCIGILAIFCLLVTAVGAASECGACVFSAASSWNECPPCVFSYHTTQKECSPCIFDFNTTRCGCPSPVFSDGTFHNAGSVCEFTIQLEGDGHTTTQVSGGHTRITVVYRSPQADPVIPDGFSRGYMGYDPAGPSSTPSGQQYLGEPVRPVQRQGTLQVSERFAGILSASSGFSRFI